MKQSSGTLLYRRGPKGWEILLVRPSGNGSRKKRWSIPKGLPETGEDMESTARRETLEETGVACGVLVPMASIDYRKRPKRVYCFAGPAPDDAEPCPCGKEVDRAEFVPLAKARIRLHPDQLPLLERVERWLACTAESGGA